MTPRIAVLGCEVGSGRGGDLVHLKTYRRWRKTGIAFEFGDQTYARPNRTLATFVEGHLKHGKDRGRKRKMGEEERGEGGSLGGGGGHGPRPLRYIGIITRRGGRASGGWSGEQGGQGGDGRAGGEAA
mgnify:CR=1 FL=1